MKWLCYYLERSPEVDEAIAFITELIPCWVKIQTAELNMREVTFLVRQEDAIAVQTALAPYV